MFMSNRLLPFAMALLLCASNAASAASTDWHDLGGSKARLSANFDPAIGRIFGTVEIDLKPGWKTYWREPGGSGIPPVFDFSRSSNFVAGEIGYPAPRVLKSGTSRFAGYKDRVVFAFEAMRPDPVGDGSIELDFLAGVCEEICIPAQVSFKIALAELNRSDPLAQSLFAMARELLPVAPTAQLAVISAKPDGPDSLLIEVTSPAGFVPALFVEGPPGWYMTVPELIAGPGPASDTISVFKAKIAGRPLGSEIFSQSFKMTLVAGEKSIEQQVVLQH